LFVPHTQDAADSIDSVLEASVQGVRAVKISLFMLLGTTILQFAVVLISGSVALLADTIHNFSDALTAVPLWIAFILARRPVTRGYAYGFGRAEDLAGLFIVAVVALSAVVAGWQSIDRLIHPQPLHNLWWVAAAGGGIALSASSRTWSGPRRRETSASPPGSGSPSCPAR
jgi:cation diffusion facilitator family transporter